MQPIKDKKGLIVGYRNLDMTNHKPETVFNYIKKIQQTQLLEWGEKLNPQLYADLCEAVSESNKGKTAQNFNAYDLKRGTSFDNFIANWSPGKALNEIYW